VNTEYNDRAKALHLEWCRVTNQPIKQPDMNKLRAWMDLLMLGHTEADIALVFSYLMKEVRKQRRNHGCLALQNFLNPETFEKDLFLARMVKSQLFDPENRLPSMRIPASPESQPHSSHSSHKSHPSPQSTPPTPKQPFATSKDFRKLLEKLS
jgi:hypothetical protein